jgi:hypothetical protein
MIATALRVLVVTGALLFARVAEAQDTVLAPGTEPSTAVPPRQEPTAQADAHRAPSSAPAAVPAGAPPSPTPPVEVQSLGQLDLFSTGRETGLGEDVWKGASADIARAVIPSLALRPLSPAAAGLARRLLAQTATAPAGAGGDLDLALARARALMALGDADDASLVFDRTPGVADSAPLSAEAAEAALISDQADKACQIDQRLNAARSDRYWPRLHAFCQARGGQADAAQLTLNLAGPLDNASPVARLLAVYVAGAGEPGPASMRGGLDYALSRALKLDLAPALADAAPAIARRWALQNPPTDAPIPDLPAGSAAALIQQAIKAVAAGADNGPALEALVERASKESGPKTRARLQASAAILASLGASMTGAARAQFAGFVIARPVTPDARLLALDLASGAGRSGETALLALGIAESGGAAGPPPADRAWIIHALVGAGLVADARAFAVEGLTQLRGAP